MTRNDEKNIAKMYAGLGLPLPGISTGESIMHFYASYQTFGIGRKKNDSETMQTKTHY